MSRSVVAAASALVLTAACGGAGIETANTPRVDTLAGGAVFVRNARSRSWTDANRWRLVEDLRIGSAHGVGPAAFGRVEDVSVDAQGRLWVLDAYRSSVLVFDPSGQFVRAFGGSGDGPGEFRAPLDLVQAPDGNVWVSDFASARIEVFDTSGDWIRSHRRPASDPRQPIVFDTAGALLERVSIPEREGPRRVVVRYDAAGELAPLDTFPEPAALGLRATYTTRGTARELGGRFSLTRPVPFAHQPDLELLPGGRGYLAWPGGGVYRFGIIGFDGDTAMMVERTIDAVPIPDSTIARQLVALRMTEGLDRGTIPREYPPFDDVYVADDQYLWVRRRVGPGKAMLDVFEPGGAYLGSVATAIDLSRYTVMEITRHTLYGVLLGELDVPYVVRLRVDRR